MQQVLRGFRVNQGPLLAGAVAYDALLSIVPLRILTVIALLHVVFLWPPPCCCWVPR